LFRIPIISKMCFWCTFEFMVLFFISNFTSGICAVGQSSRWISFKTNILESVHCLEDIKEGMHTHSVHGDFITPLLPCQGIKLGYKLHVINVLKKKVCPCNILKQSYFRWPHQVLKNILMYLFQNIYWFSIMGLVNTFTF